MIWPDMFVFSLPLSTVFHDQFTALYSNGIWGVVTFSGPHKWLHHYYLTTFTCSY